MNKDKDFGKLAERASELGMTFEQAMEEAYDLGFSEGKVSQSLESRAKISEKLDELFDLNSRTEIFNDQSNSAIGAIVEDRKISRLGADPFDYVEDLIVGTYSFYIDDIDVGSTRGGCRFSLGPEGSHIEVDLMEISLDKLTRLLENRGKERKITVKGPGSKLGIRTFTFENCVVPDDHVYTYTITRDSLTDLNLSFYCPRMPQISEEENENS